MNLMNKSSNIKEQLGGEIVCSLELKDSKNQKEYITEKANVPNHYKFTP